MFFHWLGKLMSGNVHGDVDGNYDVVVRRILDV
jgi:hypothetical protein